MGTLYQSELPPIQLNAYPFLIGAACGLGISLIAAILPSRKASHLSPLEAMRDVLPEEIEGVQWWLTGSGVSHRCGLRDVMLAEHHGLDSDDAYGVGGDLMLAGFVLLMPVALKPTVGNRNVFLAVVLCPLKADWPDCSCCGIARGRRSRSAWCSLRPPRELGWRIR